MKQLFVKNKVYTIKFGDSLSPLTNELSIYFLNEKVKVPTQWENSPAYLERHLRQRSKTEATFGARKVQQMGQPLTKLKFSLA